MQRIHTANELKSLHKMMMQTNPYKKMLLLLLIFFHLNFNENDKRPPETFQPKRILNSYKRRRNQN